MKKVKRKYEECNLVKLECKMLKAEIFEMISIIGLNDVGLLQEMKSAIINAQADYYYSILVADGYTKDSEI